jgi:hypothetical protein
MSLGVLFAIKAKDRKKLLRCDDEDEVTEYVHEVIEERWEEPYVMELDKAWDAMHRIMTDGRLGFDNGEFPRNRCILGGQVLASEDEFLVLKPAAEVPAVSDALELVTHEWFAQRYRQIDPADYGPEHGDEDLDYTWAKFHDARRFWKAAAGSGRDVLFSAS